MLNQILEKVKVEFTIDSTLQKRYYHTLGVVQMALELNKIHNLNIDENKVISAAAFHDIAKFLPKEKMWDIIKTSFIEESCELKDYPSVWHSFVGSIYAKDKYNVEDNEILDAIKYHTTGRPNMTNLEKIIFISDYIEEITRKEETMQVARNIAKRNLDEAVLYILEATISYLESKNQGIYELTKKTYQFYLKKVRKNV